MKNKKPLFILAGNGPYENRGCEAIVRGTVEILRHYFGESIFVVVSHYQSNFQLELQKTNEINDAIIHKKIIRSRKRFEPIWFLQTAFRFLYPKGKRYVIYREMLPYLKEAKAVLSVGGDNYSLDYGVPTLFTDLDNLVLSKNKPIIIWGASIGPFSNMPKYEDIIIKHMRNVTGIFARESLTIAYLSNNGIKKNVYKVADPAFLMNSQKPLTRKFSMEIPPKAIGINLSPLMARYVTNGDLNKWIGYAAKIIKEVSEKTKRPIFLVPHVTSPHTSDYEFIKNVLSKIEKRIELIPPELNAAELKWVISQMSMFVGARTHSTIAALSSCVPTLSFAYSIKAKGINQDIFGHTKYCLDPHQLRPDVVANKVGEIIQNSEEIKNELNTKIPKVKKLAMDAGKYLKKIINES